MKATLILVCLLFSTLSFAQERWTLSTRTWESAKNPKEVKALQKRYPEYMKDIRNVYSATIFFSLWSYVGETTCEAGDPRLEWRNVYVSKCIQTSGGVACPLDMPPMPPMHEDPCQEHD